MQKKGVFRHWLMWAAVSAFGNMRRGLGILFGVHVLAVWGLVIAGVSWAWAPSLTWWQIVLVIVAVPPFLALLGTSWRFVGVDLTGGWLSPTLLLAALVLVPLGFRWTWPIELEVSPFTLLLAGAVLMLLGLFWGVAVDPTLRMWLWPTTLIGLPLALIPVGLIFLAVALVWCIDVGAAVAAARTKDQYGRPRKFELPKVTPLRVSM